MTSWCAPLLATMSRCSARATSVPGQILCHSSGWSVIDLDDGHYADPLSEVAALCTALPGELGLPAAQVELARQTYLDAYLRQAGQPLDPHRWQWFLAVAELHPPRPPHHQGPHGARGGADGARTDRRTPTIVRTGAARVAAVSRDVFRAVEPASTVFARLQLLRQAISADPELRSDDGARIERSCCLAGIEAMARR